MITNTEDYKRYLLEDQIALGYKNKKRPRLFSDEIWKYQRSLRKAEYYLNTKGAHSIQYIIAKGWYKHQGIKLGFSIPLNVFGPGLSIGHYGTIVVNGKAKVGKQCRIQADTLIGGNFGEDGYPVIGDNCYIGAGAKIFGDITIGDNVKIGANAVVNKSFDSNVTLVGIPAHAIIHNEEKI